MKRPRWWRPLAAAALAVALLGPPSAGAQQRTNRTERLNRALALIREAVEELAILEERDAEESQLSQGYLQLGLLQLAAGRRAAAKDSFREALLLDAERRLEASIYAPEVLKLFAEAQAEAAAAPERRVAAVVGRTGSLAVTSDFWVNVSIDGGNPEETPIFIPRLAAGRHKLQASRAGYRPQTLEVEIREGDTQRVHLQLQPESRR